MFAKKYFLVIALVAVLCGCRRRRINVVGEPSPENTLSWVTISYDAWDDSFFGGRNAKGFRLYVTNNSSSVLKDFTLTINNRYESSLAQMVYYFGFTKGTAAFGREDFPADSTLEFTFDYDVNGRGSFVDDEGRHMPDHELPKRIKIESSAGVGEWVFRVPESLGGR